MRSFKPWRNGATAVGATLGGDAVSVYQNMDGSLFVRYPSGRKRRVNREDLVFDEPQD